MDPLCRPRIFKNLSNVSNLPKNPILLTKVDPLSRLVKTEISSDLAEKVMFAKSGPITSTFKTRYLTKSFKLLHLHLKSIFNHQKLTKSNLPFSSTLFPHVFLYDFRVIFSKNKKLTKINLKKKIWQKFSNIFSIHI